MNAEHLRRLDWLVGGLALLLVLDLLTLTWVSPSGTAIIGSTPVPANFSYTATDSPDGWLGVLAVFCAILIIVDLVLEQVSPRTEVPAIGGSRVATRFVLACGAGLFLALKFIFHLGSIGNMGIGFWIGAALVIALVYFALQARNAGSVSSHRRAGPAAPTGSSGPPTG